MAKYSFKFKIQVVKESIWGKKSVSGLAEKHSLSCAQIQRWINAYKQFGEEGLLRTRKNKTYTIQLKLDAGSNGRNSSTH